MNNPTLLEIGLIAFLATYRLTIMFNSESGPGDIFTRLRTRAGVRYDEHSRPYGKNWFAEGILCFYCLSVWVSTCVVAALVLGAFLHEIEVFLIALSPLALSGGAVFLKKWAG